MNVEAQLVIAQLADQVKEQSVTIAMLRAQVEMLSRQVEEQAAQKEATDVG